MGNIILSKLLVIFIIIFMYYIGLKALIYLLPFILGWFISMLIEPLVDLLHKKLRILRGIATFLSILIFVSITSLIITFIGGLFVAEITKLTNRLPELTNQIRSIVFYLSERFNSYYITIPPNVMNSLSDTISNIVNNLTQFAGYLATSAFNFIAAIPSVFVFILITLISTYFITKDKEKIRRFISNQFPVHLLRHKNVILLKEDLIFALFGYIRAQLILMTITFTISSIGLYLIGINYFLLIALGISILDALPIFGSGSVYIPWLIVRLIFKDFQTALFLGIIYLCVTLTRQMLEPKILGKQIGLYPLVTLMSMYVGLKVLGVFGLILGPIIMISITTFQKSGLLPRWKTEYKK